MVQTALTIAVLLLMFGFILKQARRNARLTLEKETADAENRVKREEMERQLALQNELLSQKQQQEEQTRMITALASDYWSVYYLDLDKDEGVCYQSHEDLESGFRVGDRFDYLASVKAYAKENIKEEYLEDFIRFIQPENIKARLKGNAGSSLTGIWSTATTGTPGKMSVLLAYATRRTGKTIWSMSWAPALWTWTRRPGRAWSRTRPFRRP